MSDGDEAKLHSAPNQIPPEARKSRLMISAGIILVGVILVAVGAIVYSPFTAPGKVFEVVHTQRLGAVMVSNRKETKLTVFGCETATTEDDTCKSFDVIEAVTCDNIYNDSSKLKNIIAKCLDDGVEGMEAEKVPLYFAAADRTVSKAERLDLISELKGTLEASNFTLFKAEPSVNATALGLVKKMEDSLWRKVTTEGEFRVMSPAAPWIIILVVGVFVIVGGISYLHMVCDRSKDPEA